MSRTCKIEGCNKPTGVPGTARGWCSAHYNRWKRTGDPLTTLTMLRPPLDPKCSVPGCDKERWARGWCSMHLMRWRTHGDPGPADPKWVTPTGQCAVPDCDRPSTNGITQLCGMHYQRQWKHGSTEDRVEIRPGAVCDIEGCTEPHYAHHRCGKHYRRVYAPIHARNRRDAPGNATREQIEARIAYFGNRCWICGEPATCLDHVKPLKRGGTNWPANLRPACRSCNSRKQARWFGPQHLDELVVTA